MFADAKATSSGKSAEAEKMKVGAFGQWPWTSYVGSLTRYYAGDWESVADRTARERGRQTESGRPRAAGVPKKDRERHPGIGAGVAPDARWGARAASGRAVGVERNVGIALVHRPAGLGRLRLAGAVGGLCRAADVAPARRLAEGMGRRRRAGRAATPKASARATPTSCATSSSGCRPLFDFTFEARGRRWPAHHRRLLDDAAPPARRAQRRDLEDG